MPRSYSFDHFTAARPAVSPWKRASSHEKQEMSRGPLPFHYGRAHSSTGMIYQQHREEHVRQEAMRIPELPRERPIEDAAPAMAAREEAREEPSQAPRPDLFGREGFQELRQSAMESVRRAAREAARGQALRGVKRLADDAVSGTLRVVREASDRVSRLASELSEQTTKVRSDR